MVRPLAIVGVFLGITIGLAALLVVGGVRGAGFWAILLVWIVAGGVGLLFGGGRSGRAGLLLQDPPDNTEPMPAELPGRICDRCGKMTSLDLPNCQYCGAPLAG